MKAYFNFIRNQKGGMAALLSVIVLSGIAVTTLTSAYVFLENKAKYNNRIIGSYQTSYGLEDIALNLRQVYDSSIAIGATVIHPDGSITKNAGLCGGGTTAVNFINDTMILCVPNTMYRATADNAFGCTLGPCFCVQTSSGVGQNGTYCTSLEDAPDQAAVLKNEKEFQVAQKSYFNSWTAKLDFFFDDTIDKNQHPLKETLYAWVGYEIKSPTFLGWLLPSAVAYSQSYLEDRGKTVSSEVQADFINNSDTQAQQDPLQVAESEKGNQDQKGPVSGDKETPIIDIGDTKGGGDKETPPGGGIGNQDPGYGTRPPYGGGEPVKGAYRLSVQSCAQGIASESCERCQGIECAELISRSTMCANLEDQSACPYGVGRINIKFE